MQNLVFKSLKLDSRGNLKNKTDVTYRINKEKRAHAFVKRKYFQAFNIDCSDKIQENNNFPVLKFGVWILALTLEEMHYIVLNKS